MVLPHMKISQSNLDLENKKILFSTHIRNARVRGREGERERGREGEIENVYRYIEYIYRIYRDNFIMQYLQLYFSGVI